MFFFLNENLTIHPPNSAVYTKYYFKIYKLINLLRKYIVASKPLSLPSRIPYYNDRAQDPINQTDKEKGALDDITVSLYFYWI